jgi:hypothetical protein
MDLLHPLKRLPQRLPGLWLLMAVMLLGGCEETKDDGPWMASISPYNHTAEYIGQLYVNGTWGGNSWAYGGGGSFVCCIDYPQVWRPDFTATVRWTTSSSIPGEPLVIIWHEQVVPIERYEQSGSRLNVHFLPDNKVRLLIWQGAAGTPGYRGPAAPIKPANWPY